MTNSSKPPEISLDLLIISRDDKGRRLDYFITPAKAHLYPQNSRSTSSNTYLI
jgi:hypothetical protein